MNTQQLPPRPHMYNTTLYASSGDQAQPIVDPAPSERMGAAAYILALESQLIQQAVTEDPVKIDPVCTEHELQSQCELAEIIATSMFTSGSGQKAQRLVLELESGISGNGWSFKSAVDQILATLRAHYKASLHL